ncbi:putative uncharacterized protein DDB_G0277255 isoform X3 [Musca domestica]|uniref:C2HC/C3H-type domain-containing protein n=1 Tax=Musca domestica TaxID=7370 RepID=A0ABM3V5H7_MUSDO|nr:putative uncharacterized protein DDB_G0277255 isoform X3 [Musca domestica]
MSKKMWNKIFKSKSNKNNKSLAATNKRCSIYEEYQQLNGALDLVNNEKSSDKSLIPNPKAVTNFEDTPLPTVAAKIEGEPLEKKTSTTTFNRVFGTLKRSSNSKETLAKDSSDKENGSNINSYNTTTPTETPDPSFSLQLAPCPICSRTFNPVTLRKHVGICEKMATKRRNIFDSSRQRREGTELATYPLPKNFGLPEKGSSTTLTRTKSERGQSPNPLQQVSSPIMQRKKPTEEFVRSTARASMRKLSTSSANDGMTTSSNFSRDRLRSSERSLTRRGPIQSSVPSEQCPHCDRCFGLKAYDRHVEWCKEKALQDSIKKQASSKTEENAAKARLEARTKYKAPCLKTKRSINRDKYSGAAGDENEDISKTPKLGRKTQDTGLMSMSMTSSINSESGLPDNYDPFLSAKRQLEELCSPTTESSPTTPQLPSLPATPAATNSTTTNKMSTSLTLGSTSSTNNTSSSPTTNTTSSQQTTSKTPTLTRSSSFRRTGSLRCPRRSPLLTQRVPLFAQKHRPTIQRGLSDEGPISSNFMKPEEYDEMPVRSVCVNDYAITKSPRVVRRDTSASNRKQPLKLNINAANEAAANSGGLTPNTSETESAPNTASRYVNKTDSLAVFLKYEHELEKLNKAANTETIKENPDQNSIRGSETSASNAAPTTPALTNLDGPLNAKELKDKSNNLSKQNSAKNIKADLLDLSLSEPNENYEVPKLGSQDASTKYNSVRLAPLGSKPTTPLITATSNGQHLTKPSTPVAIPLSKPSTPLTKPSTPLTKPSTPLNKPLTPLNSKTLHPMEQIKPQTSQKPVALSSLFGSSTQKSTEERKASVGASDYIDPKLINKCDNLPINLNKLRNDFKHSDSVALQANRREHLSSSSSESSSVPPTKFLPSVNKIDNQSGAPPKTSVAPPLSSSNIAAPPAAQQQLHHQPTSQLSSAANQRNSAEGRNLLKRRIRLGRNQFLYDASPEADSCSADDEANRSSMECENFMKEHQKAFDRLSAQMNNLEEPFIPPPSLPAEFDNFDFEEFLSSFENDEEQFPLFKDCREFLLNRTSKKQRSMLVPNSNVNNNTTVPQQKTNAPNTFPPLNNHTNNHNNNNTSSCNSNNLNSQHHFQFPNLPPHPKGLFDSFSPNNRATKNRYNDKSLASDDELLGNHNHHQKREIFISIETEQNDDMDRESISPNSIRDMMMGNPQCLVELEVDAADNKFSKISDDDEQQQQQHHNLTPGLRSRGIPIASTPAAAAGAGGGNQFIGHFLNKPDVQLNNAKNLIQQMQKDFRQLSDEMTANLRQSLEQQRSNDMTTTSMMNNRNKANKATGTPSGDAYADSDELSSLDGYPLSSPNSRLGVSSKTSADSAYGSLSRQRSSELTNPRNTSRNRPLTNNQSSGGNVITSRPLAEERCRQLSASSSSSSEHALPPIMVGPNNNNNNNNSNTNNNIYQKQLYNNSSNNNNPIGHDLDEMLRCERNNNYDTTPIHPTMMTAMGLTSTPNSHHQQQQQPMMNSNRETPASSSTQLYGSSSTMSSSMKMSKFCHECGSKFLIEHAKFCMDCGVKRICL